MQLRRQGAELKLIVADEHGNACTAGSNLMATIVQDR